MFMTVFPLRKSILLELKLSVTNPVSSKPDRNAFGLQTYLQLKNLNTIAYIALLYLSLYCFVHL